MKKNMKKLLVALALLFTMPVFAYEVFEVRDGKFEKQTQKIGYTLLNANKIPYRTSFLVIKKTNAVNAHTSYKDKVIRIYKGTFRYLDTEDEIAGILAHEISHVVDFNQGIMRGYFSCVGSAITPRKYEEKADKRAVDYMVNAGYNPVGLIVALNKIAGEQRYEIFETHPITSKRLVAIYEHIYKKYPQYLVDNSFKDDLVYQNFLLTSKDARKKIRR